MVSLPMLSARITLLVVLIAPLYGKILLSAEKPIETPNVPGYVMIHTGTDVPGKLIEMLVHFAGGPSAKVIYLTFHADAKSTESPETLKALEAIRSAKVESLSIVNVDVKSINDAAFAATLKDATAVWLADLAPEKLREMCEGTGFGSGLRLLAERGGAVLAAPVWMETFVPSAAAETSSATRDAHADLQKRVQARPGTVGYSFAAGSTLLLHHRSMVVEEGSVSICMAASANRPARDERLDAGTSADLVAFARSARERANPAFPPATIEPIELKSGTLVIDGGGIPKVALTRFIEAAGGPDALILAIPTAQSDDPPLNPGEGRMLRAAGARNVKTFHLKTRPDAYDAEKIKILNDAKGIWFCGGRQWRFVDAYLDTPAEQLMHEVLKRGGAIGGSSAGATIQGDYLVRGNPLGNVQMMAEGYERGLGFLKGVAIDQHFTKRKRFADMALLKRTFPQVLGLGIDEGAAVVVSGHTLEAIGVGPVCVYDKKVPAAANEPDHVTLMPGDTYDLKTLSKIIPGAAVKP